MVTVIVASGITYEIIYSLLVHLVNVAHIDCSLAGIVVTPAVVADKSPVVAGPYYRGRAVAKFITDKYLTGKQSYASCTVVASGNTADIFTVIVDCTYYSRDVGAVLVRNYGLAIDKVHAAVLAIRDAHLREVRM